MSLVVHKLVLSPSTSGAAPGGANNNAQLSSNNSSITTVSMTQHTDRTTSPQHHHQQLGVVQQHHTPSPQYYHAPAAVSPSHLTNHNASTTTRLPYHHYTKLVGSCGTIVSTSGPQSGVTAGVQHVLTASPVSSQQQQFSVSKPVITHGGKHVALHSYSNHRLVNSSSTDQQTPPKCYLSPAQPIKTSSSSIRSATNESRKAILPLVLQDHNYMAPLPPTAPSSPTHASLSVIQGGVNKLKSFSSVNGQQGSPIHFHQTPQLSSSPGVTYSSSSRTYSLASKNLKSSGTGHLSSVPSGGGSSARSFSKLSASSNRPAKAFTYSVPRQHQQPRYTNTASSHQYSLNKSTTIKSATPSSPLRSLTVVQQSPTAAGGRAAAASSSYLPPSHHQLQQNSGAQPQQRFTTTYRRAGGGATASAQATTPIITSFLSSPSNQSGVANIQQQHNVNNSSGVALAGLHQYHNTSRSYICSTNSSSSSLPPGTTNSTESCSPIHHYSSSSAPPSSTSSSSSSSVNMLINGKNNSTSNMSSSSSVLGGGAASSSSSHLSVSSSPSSGVAAMSGGLSLAYIPSPHIPPPPGAGGGTLTSSGGGVLTSPPSTSMRKVLDEERTRNKSEGSSDFRSSDDEKSSSPGPSGEETETAPEGEGDEQEDSITRCVCDLTHDDGYMIQCDRCQVWQHVICMGLCKDNIPEEYLCEACSPRHVDRYKARAIQMRKRQQLAQLTNIVSSSDSEDNCLSSSLPVPKTKSAMKNLATDKPRMTKKKKVKIIDKLKHGPGKGKNLTGKIIKGKKLTKKCNASLLHNNNNNITNVSHNSSEEKEKKTPCKTTRRRKNSSCSEQQTPETPIPNTTVNTSLITPSSSITAAAAVSTLSPAVAPQQHLTYSDVVRGWVEGYEAAITNHYSPELRARVHAARINGISPHLRASVQGAVLGHRCKVIQNSDVNCLDFEKKVLVAGCAVTSGTALLEYQGKYLLWSQWCSSVAVGSSSGTGSSCTGGALLTPASTTGKGAACKGGATDGVQERFLPFTLHYTLLQEGLSVAVDARTYGNEARFARRSCTPNAQVRHVVERGSLHLYIVATDNIDEGGEILLPLSTCNTTDPSLLPPCPAVTHSRLCHSSQRLPPPPPAVTPTKQHPPNSPHSSPVSSPSPSLPTSTSKLVKSSKLLTSPTRPSKLCLSLFSPVIPAAVDSSPRLTTPVNKELLSPLASSSPQSSPDRDLRKSAVYNKRGSSLKSSAGIGRSSRRTSTLECRNISSSFSTDEENDEEDEDDKPMPGSVPSSVTNTSKLSLSRRNSEDVLHPSTPRRRNASTDSKGSSSSYKKTENGSTTPVASKPIENSAGPAGRLRNHSSSSTSSPKSPTKGVRNKSPSGDGVPELEKEGKKSSSDSKKLTREEKKIAAYMRAFEMLEKQAQRKQEMDKRKTEDRGKCKKSDDDNSSCDETFRPHERQRKKSKKSMRRNSTQKKTSNRRRSASGSGGMSCGGTAEEKNCSGSEAASGGMSPVMLSRFPKTKKSLMNDWLSECIDSNSQDAPVQVTAHQSVVPVGSSSPCAVSLPSHYMRSAPPSRRSSCAAAVASVSSGVSAKKRWLRQAISEEPLSQSTGVNTGGASPQHTPADSSPGDDYTAPLKKRRLARESLSNDAVCVGGLPPQDAPYKHVELSEEKEEESKVKEETCTTIKKEVKKEDIEATESSVKDDERPPGLESKKTECDVKKEEEEAATESNTGRTGLMMLSPSSNKLEASEVDDEDSSQESGFEGFCGTPVKASPHHEEPQEDVNGASGGEVSSTVVPEVQSKMEESSGETLACKDMECEIADGSETMNKDNVCDSTLENNDGEGKPDDSSRVTEIEEDNKTVCEPECLEDTKAESEVESNLQDSHYENPTDDKHDPELNIVGPRTPEGSAPSSPVQQDRCPCTPTGTPPSSPLAATPDSPKRSPPSPLPSILKDGIAKTPLTTLAASPVYTDASLVDYCKESILLEHSSSPKLPLTTLGSLDEEDISLTTLGTKLASVSPSNSPRSSEQPPGAQAAKAPIKRKLSILEYRKRRSINSETDASPSPSQQPSLQSLQEKFTALSSSSTASTMIGGALLPTIAASDEEMEDEEDDDLEDEEDDEDLSPCGSPPSPPSPGTPPGTPPPPPPPDVSGSPHTPPPPPLFNCSAVTASPQLRNNLDERLKQEFGLSMEGSAPDTDDHYSPPPPRL